MSATSVDVVIVGAGPFGIVAAKTYLELNPTAALTILETDTSLGGAWSKTRIYPGMYSQSPLGMIEFSDVPMRPTKDQFHGYVPAHHVYEYLESYTKTHIYNGRDINSRIRFDSRVTSIRKVHRNSFGRNAWVVCTDKGDVITSDKLMLATGITSKPNIPVFDNDNFTPPMLHTKDLARLAPSFVESEGVRNVIVLGGSKSAFDAVHMFVSAGKSLQWVIRDKGSGPAGMSAPDRVPVYYDNAHQILATRLMSKLSPCIFEPRDSWMRFFHQTKVGRWITDRVWSSMQSRWIRAAKYERSDNMSRLRPQLPIFWSSDNVGVSNTPGFWDTVSCAKVHRTSIAKLVDSSVLLKNGESLPCDLLVMSTGWDITFPFFTPEDSAALGLPVPIPFQSMVDAKKWEHLEAAADEKIISMFPRLRTPPQHYRQPPSTTQFYLYRGMVSPHEVASGDNSIVFLGQVGAAQSFQIAETQSIWAAAYLMGNLQLPDIPEIETDIAMTNAWRRRRYLSVGERKPTFMHDELAYVSMLLRDLGVNHLRKGGWRELVQPYCNRDYKGMLEEYKKLRTKEEGYNNKVNIEV